MSSSKSGKHLVRDILLVVAVIAALDVAVVYLRVLPNPAATAAASCRDSQALAIVSDLLAMGSDPARTSRLAGATARTGARQLMPMGQAHYQFVHFSAYRWVGGGWVDGSRIRASEQAPVNEFTSCERMNESTLTAE